jgi:hypothetical protein
MPTPPDPTLEAARERVVRLLTDRYADDTLTVEEFEARLDRMHALAEPAALDAMARDLERAAPADQTAPPAAPQAAYQPAYQPAYQRPVHVPGYPPAATAPVAAAGAWALDARQGMMTAPGLASADEGRVFAVLSSTKRRGAWAVPPRLHAVSVMGELVLDLREAYLPATCEVTVFACMGNVRIILPPDADTYVEVSAFLAAADDRVRAGNPRAPRPGPRVRVTGAAIMAEVMVVAG